MYKRAGLFLMALSFLHFITGCSSTKCWDVAKSKKEILKAEKEFEAAVKDSGMMAFARYAADEAVINRNDKLIKGKKEIESYYGSKKASNAQLTWTADFVDVSASGDLAYTYGTYIYVISDSTGKAKEYKGVFHTVWKRQSNGEWKFVWD